jgi:sugar (pentulose or hexulose) kinase
MDTHQKLAIGLDVGTGGARAVALSLRGQLIGQARSAFPKTVTTVDGPRVEQDPVAWQSASASALRQLVSQIPTAARIVGLSVDATSGTFLIVDGKHRPLTPGIMYNDLRAADVAGEAAEALADALTRFGIQIAPSFALTKLLHLARKQPALFAKSHRVVHQADWIIGSLCGRYDVSDVSTALKTGVDPSSLSWPNVIESQLGIPIACLPQVVLPGTTIGEITPDAARLTGLPAGTPVIAGCTDGTAGSLASGASQPGDLNVTLGTTLVFKAVSSVPLVDPCGAIYNHRHPGGGYLPGAASSTGADWLQSELGDANLAAMTRQVSLQFPTGNIVYPLRKQGERFPFTCTNAKGFGWEKTDDPVLRLAAGMEGVAMLERMGVERMETLGLPIGPTIYATGGAAGNTSWLKVRAAVTRRVYQLPQLPECAVGAALLAAMPTYGGFAETASAMVGFGKTVEPESQLADQYDEQYTAFVQALREHGYLMNNPMTESNSS